MSFILVLIVREGVSFLFNYPLTKSYNLNAINTYFKVLSSYITYIMSQ
jgi:hypothetical protein